ncbi:MAG: hypothetical protein J07HB67_02845 [halophilic archaeon J07HB67]|jgi:hypothetical protein|nr:MAG: hypothetical protein J07HB67_02845 [halophilic archaeon J07HB67]
MDRDIAIGGVLMLAGFLLFLPGLRPNASLLWQATLVPAAALLTYGTYRVGTSNEGRAV